METGVTIQLLTFPFSRPYNNTTALLLGDLDPLSSSGTNSSSPSMGASTAAKKTPQSFLGENSALVNLDNLIKPMPSGGSVAAAATSSVAYNPFGETGGAGAPVQKNLFQQNQPQVSVLDGWHVSYGWCLICNPLLVSGSVHQSIETVPVPSNA